MKKIIFFAAVLLLSPPLFSQEFSKVGTAAAQFLKFGVDARSSALGGAHSGIYGDVASTFWNPAGIGSIREPSLSISIMDLYADISHSYFGYVQPLTGTSALGFSIIFLNSGKIEQTTLQDPNGTGVFYEVKNYMVGLTYSRYMTDKLIAGLNFKYVREEIWREVAQTYAFDIGTLLETDVLGIRLGMAISNFGPNMRLHGDDLITRYETYLGDVRRRGAFMATEDWSLPLSFRVGVAADIAGKNGQLFKSDVNRITVLYDFHDANDSFQRSSK
ncbi:MAG: PorV/PorQ family protein [Fidelibacterota bacterium]